MFKIEVRTPSGFWGRYKNFERARKVARYLKNRGLNPQMIAKKIK